MMKPLASNVRTAGAIAGTKLEATEDASKRAPVEAHGHQLRRALRFRPRRYGIYRQQRSDSAIMSGALKADVEMVRVHQEAGSLTIGQHGAERVAGAVSSCLAEIGAALHNLPPDRAGIRIHGVRSLRRLLESSGPIGSVAAAMLGGGSRPVRAILFDKTAETNWSLAWHQDRTICVKHRIDVAGFGPWTTKSGLQHVAPPFNVLARMVTLRVHLNPVPFGNAPLVIAPSSHRFGRIPVDTVDQVVSQCGIHSCLADAGDIWVYATPILHASERAADPTRRRVLQVDFANDDLPAGLEWLGV